MVIREAKYWLGIHPLPPLTFHPYFPSMCPGNHHDITQSQTISFHFVISSFNDPIIPFKYILQFRLINPLAIVFDKN